MIKEDIVNWQRLYQIEVLTNEAIGCKERFVHLSKLSKQLFASLESVRILDGGGVGLPQEY